MCVFMLELLRAALGPDRDTEKTWSRRLICVALGVMPFPPGVRREPPFHHIPEGAGRSYTCAYTYM